MKAFQIKIWIFLVLTYTGQILLSQPVCQGYCNWKVKDNTRNRMIKADIWYPSDTAGINVPISTAFRDKLPFICFGHGYLMPSNAYKNLRDVLVREGFIFIALQKEKGLLPSHEDMARDLAFLTEHFPDLAEDSIPGLRGRISRECCLMGHSMGGGAAFLAANITSYATVLCTLAPYDTRPKATEAAEKITIPSLIFAGSNDCITPPCVHQLPMYHNLKSSEKTYISIKGGSHCQMATRSLICRFAEKKCRPGSDISEKEQHTIINRYLIPWLSFYLKKQHEAGKIFDQIIVNDNAVEFMRTLPLTSHE